MLWHEQTIQSHRPPAVVTWCTYEFQVFTRERASNRKMMCVRGLWSFFFFPFHIFELRNWTNSFWFFFFVFFFLFFFLFFKPGILNKTHENNQDTWAGYILCVCAHYRPACAGYQTEGLVQEESGVGLKQPSLKGNSGVILADLETWESEPSDEPPADFLMWNIHLCRHPPG